MYGSEALPHRCSKSFCQRGCDWKRTNETLEDWWDSRPLLADLATRFCRTPADQVDDAIETPSAHLEHSGWTAVRLFSLSRCEMEYTLRGADPG